MKKYKLPFIIILAGAFFDLQVCAEPFFKSKPFLRSMEEKMALEEKPSDNKGLKKDSTKGEAVSAKTKEKENATDQSVNNPTPPTKDLVKVINISFEELVSLSKPIVVDIIVSDGVKITGELSVASDCLFVSQRIKETGDFVRYAIMPKANQKCTNELVKVKFDSIKGCIGDACSPLGYEPESFRVNVDSFYIGIDSVKCEQSVKSGNPIDIFVHMDFVRKEDRELVVEPPVVLELKGDDGSVVTAKLKEKRDDGVIVFQWQTKAMHTFKKFSPTEVKVLPGGKISTTDNLPFFNIIKENDCSVTPF